MPMLFSPTICGANHGGLLVPVGPPPGLPDH